MIDTDKEGKKKQMKWKKMKANKEETKCVCVRVLRARVACVRAQVKVWGERAS